MACKPGWSDSEEASDGELDARPRMRMQISSSTDGNHVVPSSRPLALLIAPAAATVSDMTQRVAITHVDGRITIATITVDVGWPSVKCLTARAKSPSEQGAGRSVGTMGARAGHIAPDNDDEV